MAYRSINPFTLECGAEYQTISDPVLEKEIERAKGAFTAWKNIPLTERAGFLENLAVILEKGVREYGSIMTSEMGKPIIQARAEVAKSALAARYYAENGPRLLTPREVPSSSGRSIIRYDPLGVVLAVMPWNFPFWQVIRCIAPAMMAGNSVLLKHSSNVPGSALALESAVKMAGFPDGLFINLFIDHRQVSNLLKHPAIRSVSLTGSNQAGERVASAAGAGIKKCVMELGGSDPFVVFPDADIIKAAEAAVTGRFQNNGQSCIATKRIYLHREIYREFMDIFVPAVESLVVGDPASEDTNIGPVVDRRAADELADQIARSVKMGARIVSGRGLPEGDGSLMKPVILENVPDNAPLSVEETFGPVVPVYSFTGYDEVIGRVNASRFGLGSSVWTSSEELAERLAQDIDAGTVTINGFTRSDPALPFGGIKDSGYGRELSEAGLYEFVNIKTVTRF